MEISTTSRALRLETKSYGWRVKQAPPENRRSGPADRINWVNNAVKHISTDIKDRTFESVKLPMGCVVYDTPPDVKQYIPDATCEMERLFREEECNHRKEAWLTYFGPRTDRNKIILFYGGKSMHQPSTYRILRQLRDRTPTLALLVESYICLFADLLGVGYTIACRKLHFSIVRYKPWASLRPHIDGIRSMGNSPGPIFTVSLGNSTRVTRDDGSVAMEAGEKIIDYLPTLKGDEFQAVRLVVKQGSVIAMSGSSRMEYTHTIPTGNPSYMYTLAFKFEQFGDGIHHGYNKILDCDIYGEAVLTTEDINAAISILSSDCFSRSA